MKVSALGLLALLGIASLVPTAATQPAAKQVTLGILYPAGAEPWPAFITALRDLGYQQDRNLKIEYRSANGHNEELPRLAAELVSLKPDVIVAGATPSVLALKKATASIPIVMAGSGNPVELGLVDSLSHPGGNVTGRSESGTEIGLVRFQVLRETLPGICCYLSLRNPFNPGNVVGSNSCTICDTLGIERKLIWAATPDQLDQVFAAPIDDRFKALFVAADALFAAQRAQIAEAALRRGLAAFGPGPRIHRPVSWWAME